MARFRASAALLALLAALVFLVTGCAGGGGAVATPTTLQGLADAARRSADASSGRFEFSLDMTLPGFSDSFGFTGKGAFDTGAGKTEMSIDLSSFLDLM